MSYKYLSLYVSTGSTPPTKLNPVCDPDNVDVKPNVWDNNDNDSKHKHGPLNNNLELVVQHSFLVKDRRAPESFIISLSSVNAIASVTEFAFLLLCFNPIDFIVPFFPFLVFFFNDFLPSFSTTF